MQFSPPLSLCTGTEAPLRYQSIMSPAADLTASLPRAYLIEGDLLKTSRSRSDNSIHGQPRTRLFRLTENSLEYSHHFLNQVQGFKNNLHFSLPDEF